MMVFTGLHWSAMPPSRVETIDPRTLHISGEFVEEQPRHHAGDRTARSSCASSPSSIRSSRSASSCRPSMPVTFRGTSTDVIHGFIVGKTNANVDAGPRLRRHVHDHASSKPGEHLMPCHEYCGTGHEAMWARVQVMPAEEFLAKAGGGERLSCVPR